MTAPTNTAPLLTPGRLVTHLDERAVGQDIAKRKLAGVLWWNHHRRLLLQSGIDPLTIPPRQNALLAGPSGTGKTLLVKAAAERLGVPWFVTPATSYSRVGYVGLNPEDMIAGLLHAAGGDVTAAERGIVILDEVDKLRRRDLGGQDDVGGESVQQMFLTLLEGISVQVKKPGGDEKVRVDTSDITFIAAGAFAGLEDVVLRRIQRGHDIDGIVLEPDAYRHLAGDDLVDYGLIPEFVARFPVRAGLVPLSRAQMEHLLRDFPTSPLRQAVNVFELHGIKLEIDDSAVTALLDRAMAETSGARALVETLNDRLFHVINALPELLEEGITRVIVDADTVVRGQAPWKIAGEPPVAAVNLGDLAKHSAQPGPVVSPGISNTKGWSDERVRARLDRVKSALCWEESTGSARKWWDAFERENSHRLALVLRLAEELAGRKATITEFFLAYVYSNTDNIQANLHYLDYSRLKKEEERRKRERAATPARFQTGDPCPAGAEGAFQFDGYVDGGTLPVETAQPPITLAAAERFPPAGSPSRPCWWKKSARKAERRSSAPDQPEDHG